MSQVSWIKIDLLSGGCWCCDCYFELDGQIETTIK